MEDDILFDLFWFLKIMLMLKLFSVFKNWSSSYFQVLDIGINDGAFASNQSYFYCYLSFFKLKKFKVPLYLILQKKDKISRVDIKVIKMLES